MSKVLLYTILQILFFGFFVAPAVMGQTSLLTGQVRNASTHEPLDGVLVELEGESLWVRTEDQGRFSMYLPFGADSVVCLLAHKDFISKRIPLIETASDLELGVIYLEPVLEEVPPEQFITLSEADIFEEELLSGSSEFLQASRDVFLNRVAFDLSPAFFRIRGFDSRYARVYFNGIPMNRFYDGRPQWNNWGGLNDATRNQQHHLGLEVAPPGFGSMLGITRIDVSPFGTREGFRFTSSTSNRNYRYRFMGTYNTGIGDRGWGIMLSASRRFARQSHIEGTPYEAFSFLLSLGYQPSEKHDFSLVGVYASNYRGRSSAITAEVLELRGSSYNPYWGLQDGKVRNARMRYIGEPFLNFRYRFKGDSFSCTLAGAFQRGTQFRSRLAYFNAPNPDPAYYRNLPSYYWNSPTGPNLLSAEASREDFLNSSQIRWGELYKANQNRLTPESAAYLLLSDRSDEQQVSFNAFSALKLGQRWRLRSGALYRKALTHNYALLDDLLGAALHKDLDPFSNTRNDLDGTLEKTKGDRVGYNYLIHARHWELFTSLELDYPRWNAFLAACYGMREIRREGLYRNERYPENSAGLGESLSLPSRQLKWGGNFFIDGRNRWQVNAALLEEPPAVRNLFINARDHFKTLPDIPIEKIQAFETSYYLRGGILSSRASAYYTRIQDLSEINFFFTDSGYGSAFVQEVTTGLDVLHKGLEIGLELTLSPSLEISSVLALGDHRYASDPRVSLFYVPGEEEGTFLNKNGRLALGTATIKNRKVASGPSRAFSLGMHYRSPSYWWAGLTANYMDGHYPDLSFIRSTQSFRLDPSTGQTVEGAGEEDFRKALVQRPLPPVYLLNLTGGRSWKWGPHYVSLFISIVNLFDRDFLSGGYQQGRNGNYLQWYQDHLSGKPSFGTKFWPGSKRSFFLNLSWSFR